MARTKGAVNKLGAEAKENIACAFELIGGRHQLAEWARANPTDFYRLYAKLVPSTVAGDPENPIEVNHTGLFAVYEAVPPPSNSQTDRD